MPRCVGRLVVRKRFGNELTDVRDFVRPNDFMVEDIISSRQNWTVIDLWQWVIDNIQYPAGSEISLDWHTLIAFHSSIPILGPILPRRVYSTIDFWEFPAEVLRDRIADCEGTAVLLVSMLRRVFPNMDSYVTVGYFEDHGHVWASIKQNGAWFILDTTLKRIPSVIPIEAPDSKYSPIFRFNEKEVLVESEELIIPEKVYNPGKNERIRSWYLIVEANAGGLNYASAYRI